MLNFFRVQEGKNVSFYTELFLFLVYDKVKTPPVITNSFYLSSTININVLTTLSTFPSNVRKSCEEVIIK
jgi:hypothetical protein